MQKQVAPNLDDTMKILIVILISVMFTGSVFFENSYGATTESQKKFAPKIFFQIELRDKDGHLYGYIQPRLQIFDMDRVVAWIVEHSTNSSNVVFEGQKYLLMQCEEPVTSSHFDQVGGYFIYVPVNSYLEKIFYAYYDSYLVNPNDKNRAYWEVLIPSQ